MRDAGDGGRDGGAAASDGVVSELSDAELCEALCIALAACAGVSPVEGTCGSLCDGVTAAETAVRLAEIPGAENALSLDNLARAADPRRALELALTEVEQRCSGCARDGRTCIDGASCCGGVCNAGACRTVAPPEDGEGTILDGHAFLHSACSEISIDHSLFVDRWPYFSPTDIAAEGCTGCAQRSCCAELSAVVERCMPLVECLAGSHHIESDTACLSYYHPRCAPILEDYLECFSSSCVGNHPAPEGAPAVPPEMQCPRSSSACGLDLASSFCAGCLSRTPCWYSEACEAIPGCATLVECSVDCERSVENERSLGLRAMNRKECITGCLRAKGDARVPFEPVVGNGLLGSYAHRGVSSRSPFDLEPLFAERLEPLLDLSWSLAFGSFWTATLTGTLEPEHSETYTFRITTNGRVRLMIGDQIIVDVWESRLVGSTERNDTYTVSGTIALEAGRRYPIAVDFFRWAEDMRLASTLQVRWQSASVPLEIVPAARLLPERRGTLSDVLGGGDPTRADAIIFATLATSVCADPDSERECRCRERDLACTRDDQCCSGECHDGRCTEPCIPRCSRQLCGDDGCGGTCGSACGALESCNRFGQCYQSCFPNCEGKQCGDDGCGGSCGSCASGERCEDNLCECRPETTFSEDSCPSGRHCNAETQRCCPDDGCSGRCPCLAPLVCGQYTWDEEPACYSSGDDFRHIAVDPPGSGGGGSGGEGGGGGGGEGGCLIARSLPS